MGLKCTDYFENHKYDSPTTQIITCKGCSSHLCLSDLIVSDNFNGASGPAYLVDNLINIEYNLYSEETKMITGVYKINKIKCHQCKKKIGWYYKKAYNYTEQYKEGKFVIEKNFINFTNCQNLIEKALENKYKRRKSSSASNSTDDDLSLLKSNKSSLELLLSSTTPPPSEIQQQKQHLQNKTFPSTLPVTYGTNGNNWSTISSSSSSSLLLLSEGHNSHLINKITNEDPNTNNIQALIEDADVDVDEVFIDA